MAQEQNISLELVFGDAEPVILVHGCPLGSVESLTFEKGRLLIDHCAVALSIEAVKRLAAAPTVMIAAPDFSVAYRCETAGV